MENPLGRKRPILVTIIAILLLIPTPFIILNSVGFLINPLQKIKVFNLLPKITSKVLEKRIATFAQREEIENFVNSLASNLKEEYSRKINEPHSAMERIETYKAIAYFIIATLTIFICLGLLRLKKWAYRFFLVRILASLLIIMPLNSLSSKYMNSVISSSISKSLSGLSQFKDDERAREIMPAIIEHKIKKQNKIPTAVTLLWNMLLLGYFILPKVRKSFIE